MWIELEYVGLFLASFLAATILPFSSELVLSGILASGGDPLISFTLATLGNWLGGLTSYFIGRMGQLIWIEKYLHIPHHKLKKWQQKVSGNEWWVALFCWVPAIGDLLAVVLGLLKSNFWWSALGMLAGKALRYLVWGLLTLQVISKMEF
ncbi:YqaA family protein [Thermophagus sp. OGC60D27]|uniref:YqaA family protein n=1 Tax=Thermophagus sp. OGC60D27 TaxID=3458415 RepID=UPI004037A53F